MDAVQVWANENGQQMLVVSLCAPCLLLCSGHLSLRESLIAGEGSGLKWLLLLEEMLSVEGAPAEVSAHSVDTGPEAVAGGPSHLPRY